MKKLNNLDTNKSVGPDNIDPMFLRQLANELKEPLTVIFQKSLNEGQLPDDWRNAIISSPRRAKRIEKIIFVFNIVFKT